MQPVSYETLISLQKKHRTILLLSMVFFLIALFALVSHWTVAYPLIFLSGVFYLVFSRRSRSQYAEALAYITVSNSLPSPHSSASYSASQNADDLLSRCGLLPGIACVPGAKQHHVFRTSVKDTPLCVSEIAIVRKAHDGMRSVAGTLITAEQILPTEESWLILLRDPFAGFCSIKEYTGVTSISSEDMPLNGDCTVLQQQNGSAQTISTILPLLLKMSFTQPVALAAQNGTLTFLITDTFYAPVKADPSKTLNPEAMANFHLPALELFLRLIDPLFSAQKDSFN